MGQKSLGKNSIYNIIRSCSSVIFPLITFPYISRVLQPDKVGKYNFGNSVVSYFSMLASLGITTYAIRECSKVKNEQEKLDKLASQIISINVITTIISYLLLALVIAIVPIFKNYAFLIAVQSFVIVFNTLGADWINTAMEDFKYITLRTMLFQVVSLVLMFIFVRKPQDYLKYAVITVMSASGANIVNIFYRKKFCKTRFMSDMDIKKHFFPVMGLFAMIVAQQVFTMSDTTMIGLFYGDYEVGLYSTAIKIYNIVNQLVISITWVVMPQLSLYFANNDYEEIKRILKYSMQFTVTIGVPCIIGIFALSTEVMLIVGGESYMGAVSVMRILSLTLAASFVGNFVLNINILPSGKDKVGLLACTIPAIFNLLTNLIFIPQYGIQAAAWTTVASHLLVVFICVPYLDKKYQILDIAKHMWKVAMAGTMLALVCFIVTYCVTLHELRIILCIFCGGMAYVGTLLALRDEFILGILKK